MKLGLLPPMYNDKFTLFMLITDESWIQSSWAWIRSHICVAKGYFMLHAFLTDAKDLATKQMKHC